MRRTCSVSGKTFTVSEQEMALRKKLNVEGTPDLHPVVRMQLLGAFWQHWALHKRTCDSTGKSIISVFSEDCPHPVWHRDVWLASANPPGATLDASKKVFPQMWELFKKSPIPHNIGAGNENCEYTDDWWYCKNCYLCHSGYQCEDLRYCYRTIRMKNCQLCVFSFDSERCIDLINCHMCFQVRYAFNCWQCSDSAFLYDCRNCSNCLFCHNLRNKQYCIGNQQLTKEDYEKRMGELDFRSRATYERARQDFLQMLRERAWHRALFIDHSESCFGNYLHECKNCTNCFFLTTGAEDCVNCFRAGNHNKDCLDTISAYDAELVHFTALPQDHCYEIKCCCDVVQCKWMEYSTHCFQCQHCFGCCGLVGKQYCVFNTQYASEEYERVKAQCIAHMKSTGEYGKFFPAQFAANPYEESLSGFYWPMTKQEGEAAGFRMQAQHPDRVTNALAATDVPDRSDIAGDLSSNVYWDDVARRPFQIAAADIAFAHSLQVPLLATYYMRRLQENFRLIPFNGTLRTSVCGQCKKEIETSWLEEYDGRVLCEDC
ncbi:hypothetical protein A3G69_00050, partial [Candidatus Peribacteria bacterium RIFCSPLOWO2_12_FULL_53_10]